MKKIVVGICLLVSASAFWPMAHRDADLDQYFLREKVACCFTLLPPLQMDHQVTKPLGCPPEH